MAAQPHPRLERKLQDHGLAIGACGREGAIAGGIGRNGHELVAPRWIDGRINPRSKLFGPEMGMQRVPGPGPQAPVVDSTALHAGGSIGYLGAHQLGVSWILRVGKPKVGRCVVDPNGSR
jgi:hypothetical protein